MKTSQNPLLSSRVAGCPPQISQHSTDVTRGRQFGKGPRPLLQGSLRSVREPEVLSREFRIVSEFRHVPAGRSHDGLGLHCPPALEKFPRPVEISTDPTWTNRYRTLEMLIRRLELAEAGESDPKQNMCWICDLVLARQPPGP